MKLVRVKEGQHSQAPGVTGVEIRHGQSTTGQEDCCRPAADTGGKKGKKWTKTSATLALLAVAFTSDLVRS